MIGTNAQEQFKMEETRPKASGSSSRVQGGGVTGKGQDRDEIKARQGQDRDKTRKRQGRDRDKISEGVG